METGIPIWLAGVFFLFPIIFFAVLFYTRFKNRPERLYILLGLTLVIGGWIYLGLVFDADPLGIVHIDPNQLNIFVAVVFASSPGVFRIVRGLVMDIKTRDYIAAAQTRGESPWYIMLWEILPNARGPLIVDGCLRIGYTTILLGTLGYFGLGLAPESPDWGTAIKDASRLLRTFIHPALPPTIALMSFVLGLNLLADALHANRCASKRLEPGEIDDERGSQTSSPRGTDHRDREPVDILLHQAGGNTGGDGLLLHGPAGRGDGHRRRIRVRQIHGVARHHA